MKTSTKVLTASIVSVIVAGTSLTALSNQSNGGKGHGCDDLTIEQVNQAAVTPEQAMSIALADIPGKVVEAEMEMEDGALVWEIEILNNENQVYEFEIDAKDGRILEKELDDH